MNECDKNDIAARIAEARSITLDLVSDLSDEQMMGPKLKIVNPPLWEIGHVAWFWERWSLRHLRDRDPIRQDADSYYDSAAIAHDTRWDLKLPSREETLRYMEQVLDEVLNILNTDSLDNKKLYFHLLPLYHEYMHAEAFAYTRQTLSYASPRLSSVAPLDANPNTGGGPLPGDVEIPAGSYLIGATRDFPFVFDNEKWAHQVDLASFRIARAPVTNEEFAAFVDDGGYTDDRWWSEAGLAWRKMANATHPVYWQGGTGGRWFVRKFDQFRPLENHLPVLHVNWYEADAYCRWSGRRLPGEAEWEVAASAVRPDRQRSLENDHRRIFPWGYEVPTPMRANLDWSAMGTIEVGALPQSDSAAGCRQMIGNVWEWTADDFLPYPGFEVDPYKEYSQPWFGDHKVLRGGCWTTRTSLIRNTWRNFYTPDRRDVWAGFRTCAVDAR